MDMDHTSVHWFINFCNIFFVMYLHQDCHKGGQNMYEKYYVYNIKILLYVSVHLLVSLPYLISVTYFTAGVFTVKKKMCTQKLYFSGYMFKGSF